MTTIWHNPRCSKSRQTLALLEEKGIAPTIRKYLEDAPSEADIKDVLQKLGKSPLELMRTNEAEFKELGLKGAGDDTLIAAMANHPKLIERPVVIEGGSAAIGRPPESVLALF